MLQPPNSLQVSIKNSNEKIDETEIGNTFTLNDNILIDSNTIKFKWLSDRRLLITYDKNLQTYIQNNKVSNVTIEYKPY